LWRGVENDTLVDMSAGGPNIPVGPGAINPYSPPATSIEAAGAPTTVGYRSAVGLATAIAVMMIIDVIVELCTGVNSFVTISVMKRVIAGEAVPQEELAAIDMRTGALALLGVPFSLAAGILFCFFMPRANRNASAFGSLMTVSPGWTVGWWFIPIANMWMPYQAMKEIWQGSDPDPTVPMASVPAPAVMKWWWGVYLVHSFSGWAPVFAGAKGSKQAQDLVNAATIEIVTSAVSIVAALLAAATVRAVARRQEERRKRAATAGAAP
jgi:hypothetical protein